jgi:ribonuclease Y
LYIENLIERGVEIMDIIIYIAIFLITAVIFTFVGILVRKKIAESKLKSAENEAKQIIERAKIEAENNKKEEIFKAKEEILSARKDLDDEIRERRGEVQVQEKRLIQKEENLERKLDAMDKKEKDLIQQENELKTKNEKLQEITNKQMEELQRISGLSSEEAKKKLLSELEKTMTAEKAAVIREIENRTKEEATKSAREIVGYAIQKCAADHTSETTVSIVSLPNDDMKGRIIGREGRNIKALETLTGIDLIIDDTPEAVVISGFDPLRREVAKIALEKLIEDGRIHPAKIEEMVEKAKEEVENTIKEEGERAVLETGVVGLHPDLVKLIGKLKYRTSYGQNVLNHSIEVSNLARIMADELGLDPKLARRAGLLHDIGKALDHDMEGTHVEIGVEVLKKYKENDKVINAVQAHHGDVEPQTIEAVLVQAADAISASRPGARRETLENYIKRLESLENIADSFEGVEKSFAIQAGREIRIIVKPEKISDDQMVIMARDVAKKVEDEMEYPGQIKVNLVRETRVIDYAK